MRETFGKVERMTVRGFKSIREMNDLELKDINILIGANGAGKSNLLSVFKFMFHVFRRELQYYVGDQGGANRILYFGGKDALPLILNISAKTNNINLTLISDVLDFLKIINENFVGKINSKTIVSGVAEGYSANEIQPHVYAAQKTWPEWRVYDFTNTTEKSSIRSTSDTVEMDTLMSEGGNLAAFLYYIQEKYPNHLERIEAVVRTIAPFFSNFLLKPNHWGERYVRLRWHHVGAEEPFDVSDLSDGTLRFIALAALLLQPNPPSTIIIDEPELGLHPAAIAQLAAMMHQVSPEVQIIAATQSPTFASYFGWQDFIVVERENDASTFRRLTEEEVKPWLDEFSMGAIWEMNLIGGQPK